MTDYKAILQKLHVNLNILRERESKYAGDAPVSLLNQITDHEQAITLTQEAMSGDLTENEWREALQPLNIDHTLIEGGFFQKILRAFSLPTEQQRELRYRQIMLQRVHDFWVKGVLEKSLYNEVLIELGMETKPEAVDYPWNVVLQPPNRSNRTLPPGTKIIDVFDESDGSLLILGEPGSGKTTMLLELTRQTLARARSDSSQPIPVVFNLSSWVRRKGRLPLAGWLVEELKDRYYIPKQIAELWIQSNALLLLFDGLDEVADKDREGCAQTINEFRQLYLAPVVVCSRVTDYENLATRLKLQKSVLLQPLSPQQVDAYLSWTGKEFLALRDTLQYDTLLQELTQSPLMLNIMVLAYQDLKSDVLSSLETIEARRKHLFDTYVQRMFERRKKEEHYSREQTIKWLEWLAKRMINERQTEFSIWLLSSRWLLAVKHLLAYTILSAVFAGLITGLIIGLMTGPIVGSVFGLMFGFIFGLGASSDEITAAGWSWKAARKNLGYWMRLGLLGGLSGGLVFGLGGELIFWLVVGLIVGWIIGLTVGLISWVFDGLAIGLVIGLVTGLVLGLAAGPNEGLILLGMAFGLVTGIILDIKYYNPSFTQYVILRYILYQTGQFPWRITPFLDYCVDRIFLRKVGNRYIFTHRLLMEHFAGFGPEQVTQRLRLQPGFKEVVLLPGLVLKGLQTIDILKEAQSGLSNQAIPLSLVLQVELNALTYRLPGKELKNWVSQELNGYDAGTQLPDYRTLTMTCIGKRTDGHFMVTEDVPLDQINDEALKSVLTTFRVSDGVYTLEEIAANREQSFFLPPDKLRLVNHYSSESGYTYAVIKYTIGTKEFEQVLRTMRKRLLDFVLALQEKWHLENKPPSGDEVDNLVLTHILNRANFQHKNSFIEQR